MADEYEALEANSIDYQSHLHVALRTEMKRNFLKAMIQHDSPFIQGTPFHGASLVIYGTTIISMARDAGVVFPLAGHKAGDIDIFVEPHPDTRMDCYAGDFSRVYKQVIGPFFKDIIDNLGFEVVTADKSRIAPSEIKYNQPFLCKKHFSHDEAKEIFDKQNIPVPGIPLEGVDVLMEVDLVTQLPLAVLAPRKNPYLPEGKTPVLITEWESLLSKKIARAFNPMAAKNGRIYQHSTEPNGFKPRDLIDIYNIVNATPKLVDMDNKCTQDLLRVMLVVYLARFRQDYKSIDLSQFDPTPDHITAFRAALDKRMAHDMELSDELIGKILTTYQHVVQSVFPAKGENRNAIELLPQELDFVTLVRGYRVLPTGGTQMIDPEIKVSLLKEVHPQPFAEYPELAKRITYHPTLNEICEEISGKRAAIGL